MKKVAVVIAVLSLQNVFSQVTLMDTTNRYDYVIITVPEFIAACEAFAHHKENVRNLKTLVVDTTMILNEFNSNTLMQDNIRDFISFAGTFWVDPQPKYFLLAGNLSMIPGHEEVVSSNFSYYSDFRYSQSVYDTDINVDFYIGRVPASNEFELNIYFDKIVIYEIDESLYLWNNNTLFLTEYDSNGLFDFRNWATDLSTYLPLYISSNFLFEEDTSSANYLKELFLDYINSEGISSFWLFRLNSDSSFGSTDFFTKDDIELLTNYNKPFVIFFNSVQHFTNNNFTGFSNEFLLSEGGSIAGFASVGLTYWPSFLYQLRLYVLKLYDLENKTMGEVLVNEELYPAIAVGVNLWGDPTLKLKYDVTVDAPLVVSSPSEYSLEQNYPNPFNPSTLIKFSVPVSGKVELKVYNVLGKEIKVLTDKFYTAGNHQVEFDGSGLSSGVYLYKITSGNFRQTKKMILIK